MAKNTAQSKEDQSNIPFFSTKFLYDQTTERSKKRMIQMQKRKAYLNERDTNQVNDCALQHSLFCTSEVTPNNIDIPPQSEHHTNHNAFQSKQDPLSNEDNNIEVNVSDLDCSLDSNDKLINTKAQREVLYKQSKPFIQLNNNLKIKALTEGGLRETSSYLLALKQKHRLDSKNNNMNYHVDNIIREEREVDIDNNNNNNSKNNNLHPPPVKTKPSIHKTSKSGEYTIIKKHLRFDSLNEKKIFQVSLGSLLKPKTKKKDKASHLKIITSFDLSVFQPKNHLKSNDFSLLKPKTHIRSETAFRPDISFSTHNTNRNHNQNQIKKSPKKILNTETNRSINFILESKHNKKIIHRKNLTITFPEQNAKEAKAKQELQSGSNVVFHKKANSIASLTNRDTILALLEKIKYTSSEHYINAIKYVQKSKKNIIVLVKSNKNSTHLQFQALYEIGFNNEYGCKIYAVVYCPFKIQYVEIKNCYSFDKVKGSFSSVNISKTSNIKLPSLENIHCITI